MDLTPTEARKVLEPVFWIRNFLGANPWPKQCEILDALKTHKHVAVRSCHGAGKSWLASRACLWYLYAHQPVRVITTAPTDRQVRGILWKEAAIAFKNATVALAGRMLSQELHIDADRFALGFTTTAGESGASKFQGWHAQYLLAVVDEASGVSPDIYKELEGILSSDDARLLEIGNPTNPVGDFAKAFKSPDVFKVKISAFDTPNFTTYRITQEDIENDAWREKITGDLPYPELVTPEWVARVWAKCGKSKDHPYYRSRVLADFPEAGEDTLIPLYMVEAAQNRTIAPYPKPHLISVDVARYGSDMTVIMHRKGAVVRTLHRIARGDTMETAGLVHRALKDSGAEHAVVDVVGIGAGVVDRLRELGDRVVEASAGSSPQDKDRFVNARAEWYWNLREDFEKGEIDIDTMDEALLEQLPEIKWKIDSKGRIMIESKDDMKKRGMPSPDDADAAAMTRCLGLGTPALTVNDSPDKHLYQRPERRNKPRWY